MKKIKLLSIGNKKIKSADKASWERLIDRYAPELYENFYAVGDEQAIQYIEDLKPEIILLPDDMKDSFGLVEKIKELAPSSVILVVLGTVDDEQEAMEEFGKRGVYKCYPVPLSMDTLTHDMYVALNLE